MRQEPIQLINGFYADETRPWSMQDICNYLPCAAEDTGTRTPLMAKTPPGLSPFVNTGSSDPIRGVYDAEGRLFAVAGNTAYQINNAGVAIPLGAVSGVSRARFSHNQITGGNQVLIVNGSAGWIWNTVTSTFTQITDTGYPGGIDAVFIDGYFIQIEPARRYAFNSELADGLNYNTLDRFTSEVSPDLLVALAVSNNELILFSESSTEFFENTGAAQQPFRSKRISFEKGCASRYGVGHMDNSVFWLGSDGVFYRLNGYSPVRISTRPIEQAIRGLNWSQAFAFVWVDSGHSVCYWTFPDGQTFGYDASQQKWHRRSSYGFNRWRVQDTTYWQSRWIAGDFQSGRLWELDWAYPWEGDQEFVSEITSAVIHDNQSRMLMPRLEVVMDTGMPDVETRTFAAQPNPPTISGDAPNGASGILYGPYAYTITPGSAAVVSVAVVNGTLPPGLSLSSAGVLSGTPTSNGNSSFTVRATDANGLWDEISDTISIAASIFAARTGSAQLYLGAGPTVWTGANVNPGLTAQVEVHVASYGGKVHYINSSGGKVSSSPAGASWTSCTGLPAKNPRSMTYFPNAPGTWIYVPTDGTSGYSSTDGTAFSAFTLDAGGRSWYCSVQRDPILLVGSTNAVIRRSTSRTTGFADVTLAGWGFSNVQLLVDTGTTFVAASGTNGQDMKTSPDGLTWTNRTYPGQGAGGVIKLAYAPGVGSGTGRLLAILSNGATNYSDNDGVTWTAGATAGTAPTYNLNQDNNLVFSGGYFVSGGTGGQVWTSPDGVNSWTLRATNGDGTPSLTPYRTGA